MNGIGFEIQANAPINEPALESMVKAIDSPTTSHTVLNNSGYAARLSTIARQSWFYNRNVDQDSDENDWKQYSPQAYFDKYQEQVVGKNIGLQIGNEPGFDHPQINALIGFMKEAAKRNIPISIGGFSVGSTPDSAAGWAAYDEFVQLLCSQPDLFVLDCHEYALVVPTSGMVTKDTQPGDGLFFTRSLFKKADWPKTFAEILNCYHVGRIRHLFEYVQQKGYSKPTVDIGECLMDFVSDNQQIDAWGKSLPNTNPVKIIQHVRGYKSLGRVWSESVAPGQTVQQTYMDALLWVRRTIYDALGVRCMRIYCFGNSGEKNTATDWDDFDLNTDPDMQAAFLVAMTMPKESDVSPKTSTQEMNAASVPVDTNRIGMRVKALTARNVRNGPSKDHLDQGKQNEAEIEIGDELLMYQPAQPADNGDGTSWVGILAKTGKYAGKTGWIQSTGFKFDVVDTKPIPVVTPEPPVVPPVPQTDPEVDTLPAPTNPDRLKVYDQIADHYQQLSNLFRSLAQMA